MGLVLTESSIQGKLRAIEAAVHMALLGRPSEAVPKIVARDVSVVGPQALRQKPKISTQAGQARLMHDLASIELQAMELGLRGLIEYPDAPGEFREQLAELTLGEARHLQLCLQALEANQSHWGMAPVHLALWESVASQDELLDRILIVHRYLEGSGLDAGEIILQRFNGIPRGAAYHAMKTIRDEEVGHVQFGSEWYRKICRQKNIDPNLDFKIRLSKLNAQLPRRLEPLQRDLRRQAGFNEEEMQILEERRLKYLHLPRENATAPQEDRPT